MWIFTSYVYLHLDRSQGLTGLTKSALLLSKKELPFGIPALLFIYFSLYLSTPPLWYQFKPIVFSSQSNFILFFFIITFLLVFLNHCNPGAPHYIHLCASATHCFFLSGFARAFQHGLQWDILQANIHYSLYTSRDQVRSASAPIHRYIIANHLIQVMEAQVFMPRVFVCFC